MVSYRRGVARAQEPVVGAVREVELERLREWPEHPRTIPDKRLRALRQAMLSDPKMLYCDVIRRRYAEVIRG